VEQGHIWQRRFYDFMMFTEKKQVEKLRYMHRNLLMTQDRVDLESLPIMIFWQRC